MCLGHSDVSVFLALMQDEATFSLGNRGRNALKAIGSKLICECLSQFSLIHVVFI